jgi:hypothetical protein
MHSVGGSTHTAAHHHWALCVTKLKPRNAGSSHCRRSALSRTKPGMHSLRVRGEIMGPGKYANVGGSQAALMMMMMNPMISPRTRRADSTGGWPALTATQRYDVGVRHALEEGRLLHTCIRDADASGSRVEPMRGWGLTTWVVQVCHESGLADASLCLSTSAAGPTRASPAAHAVRAATAAGELAAGWRLAAADAP